MHGEGFTVSAADAQKSEKEDYYAKKLAPGLSRLG
jgi:hypothetical protein